MSKREPCVCPECLELDRLPEELQGIPGAVQLALFERPKRRRARKAARVA